MEENLPHGRSPALCLDQEEKGLVTDLVSLNTMATFAAPAAGSQRNVFYESKISGDSGNPAFFILGGKLSLITLWTFGGAGRGTSVSQFIGDLNDMACVLAGVPLGSIHFIETDLSDYTAFNS